MTSPHGSHADVVEGAVVGVAGYGYEAVEHLQSGHDFAEHRVLVIELRGAAFGFVLGAPFGAEFGAEALFPLVERLVRLRGACHNEKLAAARLPLRVHLIGQAGRRQGAAQVRETNFGRNGVARPAAAEYGAGGCGFRVGVAALDHKVGDHAVEQQAVEKALCGQFEEIVAVPGRLVVQPYPDVAHAGADEHGGFLFLAGGEGQQGEEEEILRHVFFRL